MVPRSREQDTRDKLVRAARDLLVEQGVAALSMRRVASACGVSAPAIYRHFADKDALVCAAAVQGFRTFGSFLLDALEAQTPTLRFRRLAYRYVDFALEHSRDYQLMFMTHCGELGWDRVDEATRRETGSTFQLLMDRISECQREGSIREGDPEALGVYVWSSLHGLCSLALTGNLHGTPEEVRPLAQLQIELIERALAPEPA